MRLNMLSNKWLNMSRGKGDALLIFVFIVLFFRDERQSVTCVVNKTFSKSFHFSWGCNETIKRNVFGQLILIAAGITEAEEEDRLDDDDDTEFLKLCRKIRQVCHVTRYKPGLMKIKALRTARSFINTTPLNTSYRISRCSLVLLYPPAFRMKMKCISLFLRSSANPIQLPG